jgi:hypothetical protein
MKLPRRHFLHLRRAAGFLANCIGARLSDAAGALDCWVYPRWRE